MSSTMGTALISQRDPRLSSFAYKGCFRLFGYYFGYYTPLFCVFPGIVEGACYQSMLRALRSDTQRHTRPDRLRIVRIDCRISTFRFGLCAYTHIRSVLGCSVDFYLFPGTG